MNSIGPSNSQIFVNTFGIEKALSGVKGERLRPRGGNRGPGQFLNEGGMAGVLRKQSGAPILV